MPVDEKGVATYIASPTMQRFHNDKNIIFRYLEGPFGSGKSTAAMMEILMRSMRQKPHNGVRKSRWAIVRNTYPELKTTTIKTWQQWVPDSIAPIVYSMPILCRFKQKMADGTRVDLEVYFMALDTPEDVAKLLSLELTGAYINEAREVPYAVFEGLLGRINRYPAIAEGGATEPGVLADSNPPNVKHWLYTTFEDGDTPAKYRRYKQPPAVYLDADTSKYILNPDAENLKNLAPDYYEQQLTLSEEHIRINLAGEYGMIRAGKPVFAKFSMNKHKAKERLVAARGLSIIVGLDFGLTPAAVVGQLGNQGVRIYDEIPATDESLEDFIDEYLWPVIRSKYPGYKVIICGDPAGGGRSRIDKRSDFDVLRTKGFQAYPAITNAFVKRKEAVDYFLSRDGGMQISPELTFLLETLSAGYVFKEARNSQGNPTEIPNKNEYSHIADALQYLCLYARFGSQKTVAKVGTGTKKKHLWA